MAVDKRSRGWARAGEPRDFDSGSWFELRPGHPRSWNAIAANLSSVPFQTWEGLNNLPPPARQHQRPPPDPILPVESRILDTWIIPPFEPDCGDFDADPEPEEPEEDSLPEAVEPSAEPPEVEAPSAEEQPTPAPKLPKRIRRPPTAISPELEEQIDQLLERGLSMNEVARRIGCSWNVVRRRAPIRGRWSDAA